MGDKVEAKRTAAKLGLPLVPGSDGPSRTVEEAKRGRRRDRLSGADQGGVGRRRARHEGGASPKTSSKR
jgi:acetyl/propionyl-CoA carboxylase alpha subunit